ncbi:MAG: MFS transporter, partial [Candidatus Dormibacteraceae bacterium]
TIAACSGIGLLNVLMTTVIRHRAAANVGRFLAVNMLCLNLGSTVSSAVSVPIEKATQSVLPALGVWAVLGCLGLLCWLPQLLRPHNPVTHRGDGLAAFRVARHPLSWVLACFMGLQSLAGYITLSWVPTLLQDRGMAAVEAGLFAALLGIVGIISATMGPLLTGRLVGQRVLLVLCFLLQAIGFTGLVLAPLPLALPCTVLIGLGQGALFPLALYFLIVRAPNATTAAGLSGMGQGVGYLLTSAALFGVGELHDALSSWVPVLAAFFLIVVIGIGCGLWGTRDRLVPSVVDPGVTGG